MGKHKQGKEKKFDRNVEISAPILDPETIKAIHTPPKGQRLNIKHGGFKALLSDLNSQDSTDELMPLNDDHVPSYIGISCAVSGYSNYSSYSKKPTLQEATKTASNNNITSTPNRSRTTSPVTHRAENQIHHITIDKSAIHSADEERKELTEKLTASATEHRRSPSPCIPPTEDDRHHGTYVGARYCPLPPPSKVVNKHIPLLGIDDEQNPDEMVEDEKKVEQSIASLYGDKVVEDWRESMTHKSKKEIAGSDQSEAERQQQQVLPKDLVSLKPTPPRESKASGDNEQSEIDVPTPNIKVLAGVEKQFLNRLLTDENPPVPSQSSHSPTSPVETRTKVSSPIQKVDSPSSPTPQSPNGNESHLANQGSRSSFQTDERHESDQFNSGEINASQSGEEHITYEIRAESPVNNESSPVKVLENQIESELEPATQKLVISSQESELIRSGEELYEGSSDALNLDEVIEKPMSPISDNNNDGRYYLNLLNHEKSFILGEIRQAEVILADQESELDEDTVGRIRSAVGKANLLINKKCKQFEELCESNINKKSDDEFATLNDDLAGFWDMLNIQIGDVKKSFDAIWRSRDDGWKQVDKRENFDVNDEDEVRSSAKVSGKPVKLSAQRDQERRERLKEHINQMKQQQQVAKSSSENLLGDDLALEITTENITTNSVGDLAESQIAGDTETSTVEQQEENLFSLMGIDNVQEAPEAESPDSQKPVNSTNDLVDLME